MYDAFTSFPSGRVFSYEWRLWPQVPVTEFDVDGWFRVYLKLAPPSPVIDVSVAAADLSEPLQVSVALTFTLATGSMHKVGDTVSVRPRATSSVAIPLGVPLSAIVSQVCMVDIWVNDDGLPKTVIPPANYVGLLNQGATCYLNVVIQILFHIPKVRQIIYGMDSSSMKPPEENVVLNLQALFAQLETSTEACSTQNLTTSFGWKGTDTNIQHDVQEFWNVLVGNLEERVRTGAIDGLFRGTYRSYIRFKNVHFQVEKAEEFRELSLNVKFCSHIHESFRRYLQPEELAGENQYRDELYGRQDAIMEMEFVEFPPVLALHLRRFEYSTRMRKMTKIKSRFDFHIELDLSPFCRTLPPQKARYELFAVIVHAGNPESGHYYLYLRPQLGDQWYEFNDSIVTPVSAEKAIRENFGGDTHGFGENSTPKSHSAYMLIYVRTADAQNLFSPTPYPVVPRAARDFLAMEAEKERQREQQKIENANNHYFAVVTDSLIEHKAQLSRFTLPCGSDEATPEYVLVKKTEVCRALYTAVSEKLSLPRSSFVLYFVPTKREGPIEEVPCDEMHYVSDYAREAGILFVFDRRYRYSDSDLREMSSDEDDEEEQSFSFYREPETEVSVFAFIYAYFPRSTGKPIHFCAPAVFNGKQEMRHLGNVFRRRYGLRANEKVKIYKIMNERLDPVNKKARFSATQSREAGQFLIEVVDSSVCPSEYQIFSFSVEDATNKQVSYMEVMGYPPTCVQYLQWMKSQKEVFVHGFGSEYAVTVPLEITPADMHAFLIDHVFKSHAEQGTGTPALFANYASRPMAYHTLADSARRTIKPYEELYDIWLDFCPKLDRYTFRAVTWISHDSVFLDQNEPLCPILSTKSTAIDLKKYIASKFPQFENRVEEMRVLSVSGYEIVRVVSDYESLSDVGNPFRVEIIPPDQRGIDPSTMISVALQNRPVMDDFTCFLLDLRPGETLVSMKLRIFAKVRDKLSSQCMDNCQFTVEPWRQNKQVLLHDHDIVANLVDASKHEHIVIQEREDTYAGIYNPDNHTLKIYN